MVTVGADGDEFFEKLFCGREFVFFGDAGVEGGEIIAQDIDGSEVDCGVFDVELGGFLQLIEVLDEVF